ncbi:hypothetical protein EJP77_03335 [Paenibacillus zeisoli]|uniref:Uncharacterized protein n=1 Tax=Paenibacillus zeisoli TaxID=2496267 RepID=A0A3S1DDS1_9BACL|nr:hypothetical protein [Paenibacillus zeisoli]RUT36042.1 hypothetical protein EJP77_03335 [Paenibacillus zeisoli]
MRETDMQRQQIWRQYILGELSTNKQAELEQMLIEDEAVLIEYLEVLESMDEELPELPNTNDFTDRVMKALPLTDSSAAPPKPVKADSRWSWIKHPITHYTVAASITLLLITSGFFDQLTINADDMVKEDSKPYSEQWMNKATSWLDTWNNHK